MKVISIHIFLFLGLTISCQINKDYLVNVNFIYGWNLVNPSNFDLGLSQPIGFETNYSKVKNGPKPWEQVYKKPQLGWSLHWINHQNSVLGDLISIERTMNLILIKKSKFEWFLSGGLGFMYTSKKFDLNKFRQETTNTSISQNLNFKQRLGMGMSFYPIKKMGVFAGVDFSHFSNGGMTQPNYGLNLINSHFGIILRPNHPVINDTILFDKPKIKNRHFISLNLSSGWGQRTIENTAKYLIITSTLNYDYQLTRINLINIGLDLFINEGIKSEINNNFNYKNVDYKRMGISIGQELAIDKLSILTQVGYQFYSPYPAISDFYQKLGLKYFFIRRAFVSVNLRIYEFEISDELTFGIGFRY